MNCDNVDSARSAITAACTAGYKTAYGYHWQYKDTPFEDFEIPENKRKGYKINIYKKENHELYKTVFGMPAAAKIVCPNLSVSGGQKRIKQMLDKQYEDDFYEIELTEKKGTYF